MFTGIIRKVEKVKAIKKKDASLFAAIGLPKAWKIKEGESISINGVCSTVRTIGRHSFQVEYMPETIKKTTVSKWGPGSPVNLEQSLKLSDFIDGHLVQGHVDTTGAVTKIEKKGLSKVFIIKVPKDFMALIAPKGSIVLDGVSLTVVDVWKDSFSVSLVSYTLENTTFGSLKAGDRVNVETDMLAKYIFNILKKR
jgi:riboflavin synthase